MRFDPEQGQTSVMSIPRDLLVNITTPGGQYYANEKINAAYTIGSKLGGTKGGMLLAAETIKREVFPGADAQRRSWTSTSRASSASWTRSAAPT